MRPTRRALALVLLLVTAAGLGAAYVMQYGFGLEPCELCLYQRYPYMAAVAVLAVGLGTGRLQLALALALLLYLTDAGIALFHTGVEAGIFALPEGCAAAGGPAGDLAELKARLLAAEPPRCDRPAAVFLGLSIAAWNALLALGLAALAAFALWSGSDRGAEAAPRARSART